MRQNKSSSLGASAGSSCRCRGRTRTFCCSVWRNVSILVWADRATQEALSRIQRVHQADDRAVSERSLQHRVRPRRSAAADARSAGNLLATVQGGSRRSQVPGGRPGGRRLLGEHAAQLDHEHGARVRPQDRPSASTPRSTRSPSGWRLSTASARASRSRRSSSRSRCGPPAARASPRAAESLFLSARGRIAPPRATNGVAASVAGEQGGRVGRMASS